MQKTAPPFTGKCGYENKIGFMYYYNSMIKKMNTQIYDFLRNKARKTKKG